MSILVFMLKFLGSGAVDRVLSYMERKAETETEREKIRTQATIELIKASVSETQIMADFNKEKLSNRLFWGFAALFILPLAFWWSAVILDSVFLLGWNVDTVPILEEWGGQMIQWVFYVGGGVAALKTLIR